MNNPDYTKKSWIWQASHERDGWFSTTKTHRNVAFIVVTGIILFTVWKGNIPPLLPEIIFTYFGISVTGRIADRWTASKKEDAQNAGSGP